MVSYNVRFFLEQCLYSVRKALQPLEGEIIVVDNASVDDTLSFLSACFPEVVVLQNDDNPGFSKANNQALRIAKGKYVLFLNPDTIVPEDCFVEFIRFLETHPLAGACGVRMIDGSGQFLKESKRGFPTPWASFSKITGLSDVFSSSRFFSAYYLGHLNSLQVQEVDALAGACMIVQRNILEDIGGFDERFFLYAEDIDLSYRLKQNGYYNYYLPYPAIIHFKGESTQKGLQYISQFHKAMEQFVEKHGDRSSAFMNALIKNGVALKSMLAGWKYTLLPDDREARRTTEEKDISFFLMGDEASSREAELILTPSPVNRAQSPEQMNVVLCEGRNFPFSSMINLVDKEPGKKYWFHAKGSSAVIASFSKDKRGKIKYSSTSVQ
ncbi:MAG TPA: glycosyltransferase family 2 protein [Flavitalea sp.]|nr:glycosyltransferase family 2 protein [Flavitalea sp.]